jgi:hypothetical protein
MRVRISHIVLFPALLVGACAQVPPHAFLPDAARDKIGTTEAVAPIRQSEVYVFVPASTAGAAAGGILGALVDAGIDSVRTSKAETAVKPLRDSLVDYNYDQTLDGELKGSLAQVPFLGVSDVRVIKEVTPGSLDGALENSKAGAVLIAISDYRLSNDANVMDVTLNAALYSNNDALRAIKAFKGGNGQKTVPANALYRNVLAFETMCPGCRPDGRDGNISIWSGHNGALMRSTLNLATSELAQMLAKDIQRHENEADPADARTETSFTRNGQTGAIVGKDATGEILRFKDGTLQYATNAALGH